MMKAIDSFPRRDPARLLTALGMCAALAMSSALAMAQVQVAAKTEGPAAAALSAAGSQKAAQEGPIRGPVLGYVFDSSTLRLMPVLGIPGASYVADPMPIGFTPRFVEISPNHEYAVGAESGSGDAYVIDLRSPLPSAERLTQVTSGADRAFLSPLGKAVAFYYRQAKQVEILNGLPGEPNLLGRIDLRGVTGMVTALAVSDDGQALAVAASEGDSGSLFLAAPDEDVRQVGPLGRASALAFLNGQQDLLIADAGRHEVVRVRNPRTAAEWMVLASRRDGIDQPVAVTASRDNATAFAVDASNRSIALLPLSGGAVEFLACSCTPTGLDALAPGSVFRLTSAAPGPMHILDARPRAGDLASRPRVLFIPAEQGVSAKPDASTAPRGRVRR